MNNKNKLLYEFIIEHSEQLSDTWIYTKKASSDTIYSSDASITVENKLRTQNQKFIHSVARAFLTSDSELTLQPIKEWAIEVAKDRVSNNTMLNEIIPQFKQFRNIYWKKINEFILMATTKLTKEDILIWSNHFHFAFDTVIEEFVNIYTHEYKRNLLAQRDLLLELSSPIITLTNKISILPLIGDIDTQRAKHIMESSLVQCHEKKVEYLVIDLSGVPIVDTLVANQIFLVINSLDLLGVKSIISGIRPEVAQTTVQLGIDFTKIPTFSTLQKSLAHLNFKIVQS